ncbi:NAD-dependent 4,6-dehydratase LegB [Williamwhitmania taraxaci]|uniref:NAD dependent epimerase/dehydratase, LLPSF_EDH_00030 family n=1 Tax=Williamwhitmania taraxaci TaxID=1640674 RepID=A0A1G6GGQ3_9BACT|nr:NAD-dependent 4,6-dehydratase LegB [Williamwhitmania taraxaci]SDB81130.1 NAD dependent epimerase/dehydratase, LLPSF_EDH_00030 family [Williamwhitmania taraxaci]
MKRILVTGADGFIGSHLTELLLSNGFEVRALAQYNSFNHWGWLEDISNSKNLEIVTGDVRDPFFCEEIAIGVDTIFHLAALIAIPYSYKAPQSYIETNVTGTLNICNAALKNGVKRVLVTSTSEVYGTAQYVPIDEKHPKQPQSPYSASKIGADAMALSYFNAFNLPVTIVRPFNTYGPRQSARAIIPTIITQIAAGIKEIKLGDLTPTRDFNYVRDTCRGFLAIAQCDDTIGREVNIASNYEISMFDTLGIIKDIFGSDTQFISDEKRLRPQNSEVLRLWGDNSLIKQMTGWSPEYDIRKGMEETIKWFTNADNLKKYKTGIYNV